MKKNPLGAREEKNPFSSPLLRQFYGLRDFPRTPSGFQMRIERGFQVGRETGTLISC